MRAAVAEKDLEMRDVKRELAVIYEINDSNVKIKQTLDERLLAYDDSLGKIYNIVEQLNTLQPDAVFFSAVDVTMKIMSSADVSIYIVTGAAFKMCRLMGKSPNSEREHKKSVALQDLKVEMVETLQRNEIFVNRELDGDAPMMAAPIFSSGELVSIIMLWDMKFENLTLYNVNRFMVLSSLISSVIERAYIHTQSAARYITGTKILREEAFADVVSVHKEAAKNETSSYQSIRVSFTDADTGVEMSAEDLSVKMQPLLRQTDYMGLKTEANALGNEKASLYVLLTNTSAEDMRFVYKRLGDKGIHVEEGGL
jgi:hypothetical protein